MHMLYELIEAMRTTYPVSHALNLIAPMLARLYVFLILLTLF
jgi:hypothetical protein